MHFQRELGELIALHAPLLVVETGVKTGTSTRQILENLPDDGRLISIDPEPQFTTGDPRWTLIQKPSYVALPEIVKEHYPWDFFIHDSDHWIGCMVYELEFAWEATRDNAPIVCDDWDWDGKEGFSRFADRHKVRAAQLGAAAYVLKSGVPSSDSENIHGRAMAISDAACKSFGLPNYLPIPPGYVPSVGPKLG